MLFQKYLLTLGHRLQFPDFPLNLIPSIRISSYRLPAGTILSRVQRIIRKTEVQIKYYKGITKCSHSLLVGLVELQGMQTVPCFSHFSFVLDPGLHSDLGVFPAQHFSDNSPHGLQDPCSLCFYSNSPVLLGQKQFSAAVVKLHFFIPFFPVALATSLSLFWSLGGGKFHPPLFLSLVTVTWS